MAALQMVSDTQCLRLNFIDSLGKASINFMLSIFSPYKTSQASRFWLTGVRQIMIILGMNFHFSHTSCTHLDRYFIGGTVLQRPSLTLINGYVIGAFGGHCDLFNYTGMLVSVSTLPWVGVASIYAMEASPGAPPVQPDIMVQKGGKAGIWASGMGIATDNGRIYIATG